MYLGKVEEKLIGIFLQCAVLACVGEVAKVVVMEQGFEAFLNRLQELGPIWVTNFLFPSDEPGEGVPLQVKGRKMHLFVHVGVLGDENFVAFV